MTINGPRRNRKDTLIAPARLRPESSYGKDRRVSSHSLNLTVPALP